MGFEGTHDKIKILDTSHFGYRDLLLPNGYVSSIPENNPPYVLWGFYGKNMYIAGACSKIKDCSSRGFTYSTVSLLT